MKLIVGLGNPGAEYEGVRHNLGFAVIDELGNDLKFINEAKFKAEIARLPDLILIKPQTYMNNSGMAVKALADYFKVPVEEIIIIHDDLDLPLGKIKIRLGGAAGGHHGVESIINSLGDDKFIRVRLGIGTLSSESSEKGGQHVDVENFVLENFTSKEKPQVKRIIKQAGQAIEILLSKGLEVAQNQFN
ncbi:MAG: aminoacyl-tRNA hydrolase [Candidatus Daviesbacteria bacterium]